jgi:thiol-disulfide isomerase/thioredoxin
MIYRANLPSLVLFKANWCPHCVHFMPIWNALMKIAPLNRINMVTVDSDENKDFVNKIKVLRGFPSIFFVPRVGNPIMYGGSRDPVSIVDFVNGSMGEEVLQLPAVQQ